MFKFSPHTAGSQGLQEGHGGRSLQAEHAPRALLPAKPLRHGPRLASHQRQEAAASQGGPPSLQTLRPWQEGWCGFLGLL